MSHTERAKYLTDLTDEQWQILRKLLPERSRRGAPQTVCRRAVLNAIIYVVRSGCPWRLLFPTCCLRGPTAMPWPGGTSRPHDANHCQGTGNGGDNHGPGRRP